jgi:hypothetical protein
MVDEQDIIFVEKEKKLLTAHQTHIKYIFQILCVYTLCDPDALSFLFVFGCCICVSQLRERERETGKGGKEKKETRQINRDRRRRRNREVLLYTEGKRKQRTDVLSQGRLQ